MPQVIDRKVATLVAVAITPAVSQTFCQILPAQLHIPIAEHARRSPWCLPNKW
jgi:hypothetical protein